MTKYWPVNVHRWGWPARLAAMKRDDQRMDDQSKIAAHALDEYSNFKDRGQKRLINGSTAGTGIRLAGCR
jgi:hypothetical protein